MSSSDHEKDHKGGELGEAKTPVVVDEAAFKRALLKLDVIFLPVITLVYFLNFLDRSNIGNAKAAGLMEDLGINAKQYSIALTVTYVPYIAAELPLTLAIKKVGPNILIPTLVVAWGLVTTFQGFIHNYEGLLAARFFLGATEGAILPSSMTYLSNFYRRADMGKRVAFFFSATSLAGAFSGLLAAALINMDGLGGKKGWAWIFIIEGLFTVVCGFATFFVLPRTPGTAWWLTPEERAALVAALERDAPLAEQREKLTLAACVSALKAPQVWLMFLQFFASGAMLYAMAFFSPTIVGSLGYKGTKVQLMSVPPFVASAAFALMCCWASDRLKMRGPFVILAALVSVVGYAMYRGSEDKHVRYGALFLQVMGAYTVAPLQSTWMPNNLAPFYRRVTGITMGFISTNSGGILSTWLFPKPPFNKGTDVLLALSASIVLWAGLNMAYLGYENKKRARAGGYEG
ncbi:MFS general substrate transporter, partial [Cutaneotrichosporon oleaginosum]